MTSLFAFIIFITNGMDLVSEPRRNTSQTGNENICSVASTGYTKKPLYFRLNFASSLVLVVFMMLYCCLMGFAQLSTFKEMKREKLFTRNLQGPKNIVVRYKFYQYFDTFTNTTLCLSLVLTLRNDPGMKSFVNFLVGTSCLTSVWSVLFSLQLSPFLGHFTIAMQRMVRVLAQFLALYVIMFLPYAHGLFRLIQDSGSCLRSSFSPNIGEYLYNSFLVSLNMVDFRQFKSESALYNYYILLYLHVSYAFVLIILLTNFLIALLSTSVAEVMEHKEVIMLLQQMNVVFLTEGILAKLSCISGLLRHLQRKHFHFENGRFYLKIVSLNKEKV